MDDSIKFAIVSRILQKLNMCEFESKENINIEFDGKFHRYKVKSDPQTHVRGWFVASSERCMNLSIGNLRTDLNINICISKDGKLESLDSLSASKNLLSAASQRQKFVLKQSPTDRISNYWKRVVVVDLNSLEMEILNDL